MSSDYPVTIYRIDHGRCPYLPGRRWQTDAIALGAVDPAIYEKLIGHGWRRSGTYLYRNRCPGCNACIPIRIPTGGFRPSRSQRRVLRKNRDVRICERMPHVSAGLLRLYERYIRRRHDSSAIISAEQFASVLVETPVPFRLWEYRVLDRLVAASWVDILPNGISSVYFAFEPDESHRSLGTLSILREIEQARKLGKSWYYIGFWVQGSPSMQYKNRFRPYELAYGGRWHRFEQ